MNGNLRTCVLHSETRSFGGTLFGGYYAWRQHIVSKRSREDAALNHRIRLIHAGTRGLYGATRIHILEEGLAENAARVGKGS